MDPALAELGMDLERHVTSLAEAGADAVQELSTIGQYRELRPRTPGLGVTHNFAVSLGLSPVKAPVGNSLVHSICPRDVSVVVLCQPPGGFLEAKAGYGFPLHVVDLYDTEPVARGNRTIISDLYRSGVFIGESGANLIFLSGRIPGDDPSICEKSRARNIYRRAHSWLLSAANRSGWCRTRHFFQMFILDPGT